jgi:hypothetical protein
MGIEKGWSPMPFFGSGDCPIRVADSCFLVAATVRICPWLWPSQKFHRSENGTASPRTAVAIPSSARKRWRLHVEKRSSKSLRSAYFGQAEPQGTMGESPLPKKTDLQSEMYNRILRMRDRCRSTGPLRSTLSTWRPAACNL